ncbi:MAG: hypothetical protein CBC72_002415 [Gammaproteobacteria bacterium TMED112]|nr:MAG: hypothetical protein CBC72_002415 [Gammaproteobacteria bacterium TMED112]|tara:strand:+ start:9378 stop:9593 length:216 start_codon:yes stop_codon:yes gene_type:complete
MLVKVLVAMGYAFMVSGWIYFQNETRKEQLKNLNENEKQVSDVIYTLLFGAFILTSLALIGMVFGIYPFEL